MKAIKKVMIPEVILFLLLIGFIIVIPLTNNYSAYQVEKDLCKKPLPAGTKLVESVSQAGKLNGNGNGMQYFGAILIKSEQSLQELDMHYSGYRNNDWEYVVEAQEEQRISVVEHTELCFETEIDSNNYYIVYSWGEGIPLFEELDIRGH